jgi:ATP-dependent helicase/nuclease subunit A
LRQHLRERVTMLQQPVRGRILRTLDVMDAALQHTGIEPLASRVERTWRSLGGDLCTNTLGRENVRQFLRVVDAMETEGERVDAASLERRLGRLYAEASSAPDAVDVMTIHKAKGLEWDLVLVPGLHRLGGQDRWPLLDSLELPTEDAQGVRDVLLAPLPPKGVEAGSLNTFIRNTRRRREAAELKRVFYVAATRARTALHLFAWPEATQSGLPADRKSTLMKAAWNAIGPRLTPVEVAEANAAAPTEESFALAASAEEGLPASLATTQRTVMRLPDAIDPLTRLHARSLALPPRQASRAGTVYQRPDGSYGARVVGNAIHAFAERAANEVASQVAAGDDAETSLDAVAAAIPGWHNAMLATLRAGGLPPDAAKRAALTVEQALSRMLTSPEGRWLLMPHTGAATETAWRAGEADSSIRVRMDRSFFAGPEPSAPGSDTLWIVDLKTGNRDSLREQDELLAEGRIKYASQLDTYAQVRLQALPPEAQPTVMLALFYPLMNRIIYWPYVADSESINPNNSRHPATKEEPAIELPVADAQSSSADTAQQPPENKKGQFQLF